jgi:uncharacterized protein (DUF58 family)
MARNEPLIEAALIERLERLALRWNQSFTGLLGGSNLSRVPGGGYEFLDHRHFCQGDDLRAVNWRAYLRFDRLLLKLCRLEPHTPIRLMLDRSLSMSTGARPKFEYARKLAAALCYVGLVRVENLSIQPFSDGLSEPFRCSGGRHRFGPVVDYLSRLETGGRTDYSQVVRQLVSDSSRRGLAIVISDFLDDRDCEKPLRQFVDRGHELTLIQLWAEEDRTPPWEGELYLSDAETGAKLNVQFDSDAQAKYTAAFDEFCRSVRQLALRSEGRYIGLSTSTPIEEAIFGPLARAGGVA